MRQRNSRESDSQDYHQVFQTWDAHHTFLIIHHALFHHFDVCIIRFKPAVDAFLFANSEK